MASGKFTTAAVVINNIKSTTVSKAVELVVVGDQLVAHANELNPGVNSKELKN